MKKLHLLMAAALIALPACNDEPLIDLDTIPPTANAGADQTVTDGDNSGSELVQLDGSGSEAGSYSIVSYTWTEGGTELIGTTVNGGRTVNVDLDVGVHNITLEVEDEAGRSDTDDVTITVEEGPAGNTPPTAAITAPDDASEFFNTQLITFEGTGTDAEDGNLTGALLVWSSDVDGVLSEGSPFVADASTLTLGAHTITLTATDTEDATGTDEIGITIVEATSLASFADDVQTYFTDSGCTGCHGGAAPIGGFGLDSWENIVRGETSGGDPLIVIGDDTMGALIPQLLADHQDGVDDQGFVDVILSAWINDGAPNN